MMDHSFSLHIQAGVQGEDVRLPVSCGGSQLIFSPPNIVLSFNVSPAFAANREHRQDVLVL